MKHIFTLLFFGLITSCTTSGQNMITPIQEEMININKLISLQTEYASYKISGINAYNEEFLYNKIKTTKPLYKFELDKIIEFKNKTNKTAFKLLKKHMEIRELFLSTNKLFTNSSKLTKDVDYIKSAITSSDMKIKIYIIESVNNSWIDVITVKESIDEIFIRNKNIEFINELEIFFNESFLLINQIHQKCFANKLNTEIIYNDDLKATEYLEKISNELAVASELTIETLKILNQLAIKFTESYKTLSASVPNEALMKLY